MFMIRMAGLTIQINNHYLFVRNQCEEYIIGEGTPDLVVTASKEEILAQMEEEGGGSRGYAESLCIYRNICMQLPKFDAFLMHGAAISVDGEAYLFLAKSGVGKTTHIKLWLDAFGGRASVINGDKPILRRFESRWHVCGTPWCGKECMGENKLAPLKALCFVERGEENAISRIASGQVTGRIFHQLLLPNDEEMVTAFFENLEDMLCKVPCWRLECNMDPEAAQVAYTAMSRVEF